jgi:enoyl-CoA hydratase/carnithine racemase
VVLLSAEGKHFSSGLDLSDLPTALTEAMTQKDDVARKGSKLRKLILVPQD